MLPGYLCKHTFFLTLFTFLVISLPELLPIFARLQFSNSQYPISQQIAYSYRKAGGVVLTPLDKALVQEVVSGRQDRVRSIAKL